MPVVLRLNPEAAVMLSAILRDYAETCRFAIEKGMTANPERLQARLDLISLALSELQKGSEH